MDGFEYSSVRIVCCVQETNPGSQSTHFFGRQVTSLGRWSGLQLSSRVKPLAVAPGGSKREQGVRRGGLPLSHEVPAASHLPAPG